MRKGLFSAMALALLAAAGMHGNPLAGNSPGPRTEAKNRLSKAEQLAKDKADQERKDAAQAKRDRRAARNRKLQEPWK